MKIWNLLIQLFITKIFILYTQKYFLVDGLRLFFFHFYCLWALYFLFWFMFFDLIFYILWILFSYLKPKKLIYENKNLFYIYLKIIPFVSSVTVFIWTFLSEKRNFKKDFLKIFVWNLLLMAFSYPFTYLYFYLNCVYSPSDICY